MSAARRSRARCYAISVPKCTSGAPGLRGAPIKAYTSSQTKTFRARCRRRSAVSTTSEPRSTSGPIPTTVWTGHNFGFSDGDGVLSNVNNPRTAITAPVFNEPLGANGSNVAVAFHSRCRRRYS